MLIVLKSINVFKIENVLLLIMKSIELLMSCIHFTSMIFRRSYDCCKFMTSIMSRFFYVVSSLIRQSYNDFNSMQSMKDTKRSRIADNVALRTASRSKSWASEYSLAAERFDYALAFNWWSMNDVSMLWICQTYNIINLWEQISIICERRIHKDHWLKLCRIEWDISEFSNMIVNLSLQLLIQCHNVLWRNLNWLSSERQIEWCLELTNWCYVNIARRLAVE
jgi:hypothetical protein